MHLPKCKNRSWAVNQQTSKHFLDHEEMSTFLISYKVLFIIKAFLLGLFGFF